MPSPLTILSVSGDNSLLTSRRLLLRNWGYQVRSAATSREALAALDLPTSFDLVLLCHSIPEAGRVSLVAAIKQRCPRLPILMLQCGPLATEATVDATCVDYTPENILGTIQRLTEPPKQPFLIRQTD